MSTRDFSWGKGSRCVWLTTYHPCSAGMSRKPGALTSSEPLGPPRPVVGEKKVSRYFLFFALTYHVVYHSLWSSQCLINTLIVRHDIQILQNLHILRNEQKKKLQQEGDGSHTLTSNNGNKKRHGRCLGKGYISHRTNKKIPGCQVGPACGSSIHLRQLLLYLSWNMSLMNNMISNINVI